MADLRKQRLGFVQLWNMSFGFLGIQFGFALQNANVSRIFETLGASIDDMPILWIAAPTTGLLVQPLIGHFSDRTWTRLGRRRPYFLVGAILASLALIIMPHSTTLWIAAGMLWILDASINISMEPFRALVADILPEDQHTAGFAMQSFFIGTGAVIASALPWMMTNWFHISNTALPGVIPPSVRWSFYMGALAFIGAVCWTVFTTKEYPPVSADVHSSSSPFTFFRTIVRDFMTMPNAMRQLAFVQFFSWLGLFCMWIYTTSGVAQSVYGVPTGETQSSNYNTAADWVGVCFAVYNGIAALTSFGLAPLASRLGTKATHALCLACGAVGFAGIFFASQPIHLLYSMIGVGVAWSSILSMPYVILAGTLPPEKTGVYMGIFNFFIVLPQISAALVLGSLVKYVFGGQAIYALAIGSITLILAACLTMIVRTNTENHAE